jgi:hypothetical protein
LLCKFLFSLSVLVHSLYNSVKLDSTRTSPLQLAHQLAEQVYTSAIRSFLPQVIWNLLVPIREEQHPFIRTPLLLPQIFLSRRNSICFSQTAVLVGVPAAKTLKKVSLYLSAWFKNRKEQVFSSLFSYVSPLQQLLSLFSQLPAALKLLSLPILCKQRRRSSPSFFVSSATQRRCKNQQHFSSLLQKNSNSFPLTKLQKSPYSLSLFRPKALLSLCLCLSLAVGLIHLYSRRKNPLTHCTSHGQMNKRNRREKQTKGRKWTQK